MSVELIKDILNYERLVGEGTSQAMVSGDMVTPDRNPEIGKVLNVDGCVSIISKEVVEDRIILEGRMMFEILYTSLEGGIYKMEAASNFNQNIHITGAQDKMLCKVMPEVEHIEHELLSSKRIKVNAVINLKGTVYDRNRAEVITDMKGNDVQILKDTQMVNEIIGDNSTQTIIKGKFEVPEEKAEIKNILKKDVHVHKKDVVVLEGKIIVNACALIKMMYDTTDHEMHYTEQDIAFTTELNMPDVDDSMKCDVRFKIEDIYDEVKENEAGERKAAEVEVVIETMATVYNNREFINLVDAYSPLERYDFSREDLKGMSYYGEGCDNQTLKETITIPAEMPSIAQLKHVNVKPILTETKMVEEKIIVEGVVSCCVMYLCASEEGNIESFEEELPFKSIIDVPGAKIDMMPEVKCNVENVQYSKNSAKDVDVKIMIEAVGKVYAKYMLDIVKNIEEVEMPETLKNMPSLIIYPVQQSDNLWKIAKKYFATQEDIMELNELDSDEIKPGMKLLIPKKNFMK